jgi:nucleoside-diphosphate kinase
MERTLVLVKPDGVQRGLIGVAISRLEARGLKLVAMKMIQIDRDLAGRHYAIHEGKSFFPGLIAYITSAPVVAMVWEGPTMGATDPLKASAGTIRGEFAVEIGRNLVHGSDSPENAQTEIALFFAPGEILSYARDHERWITEL